MTVSAGTKLNIDGTDRVINEEVVTDMTVVSLCFQKYDEDHGPIRNQ